MKIRHPIGNVASYLPKKVRRCPPTEGTFEVTSFAILEDEAECARVWIVDGSQKSYNVWVVELP